MQNTERKAQPDGHFKLFVLAVFRGISQVLLIENAATGLIVLAAIVISSYPLGLIALACSVIGTWIGYSGGKNRATAAQGLFGYNSVLAGLAFSLYLDGSAKWAFALAGAAVAALATAAAMHVMRHFGLPVLTFPYIVLTWMWLLAAFHLNAVHLNAKIQPQDIVSLQPDLKAGTIEWLTGLINGVGQVYFVEGLVSGILILLAIFVAGWRLGLYAIAGTVIGGITAYGLGAETTMLNSGLYGFNAVLAVLAVSFAYRHAGGNNFPAGLLAAILTVPVAAGIETWLNPYGLPALTMPFVLVTWVMIAGRQLLNKP